MKANLHFHSRFSDGTQWPEEIVARASVRGLGMLALTDHDSMEGVPCFLDACGRSGLAGVAGVEIDCVAPEIGFDKELLGYFPSGGHPRTLAFLRKRLDVRERRMAGYVARARELFRRNDIRFEDLLASKIGFRHEGPERLRFTYIKPNLFNYLRELGALPPDLAYGRFKKEYFVEGRLGDGGDEKPHVREAMETIRADGGLAVLPHPGHLFGDDASALLRERARFEEILRFFIGLGLWGTEIYCYDDAAASDAINAVVGEAAGGLGLRLTCGSDCHGRGSPKDTLDRFVGDFDGF